MADFEYLYADLSKGIPLTPGGAIASFDWVAGQSVKYALKFKQTSSAGTQEDVLPSILNLRAAIGREGARPETGWFKLKIGLQEKFLTPRLDLSSDAPTVEEALNGILDGPRDFECDQNDGAIIVRRANGQDFELEAISDGLRPSSYSKITGGQKVKKTSAQIDLGPIRYIAAEEGDAGNEISVEYVKANAVSLFSIEVIGKRIVVNLKTKEATSEGVVVGYDVETTQADIVNGINSSLQASSLVRALISPQYQNISEISGLPVPALARAYLYGGINGSGYEYSVEFLQAPVAFSDWAGSELPPKPSIQKIQAGWMSYSGFATIRIPTIMALYLPPDFEGAYQFYRPSKLKRTDMLSKEDGVTKIKNVLDAMLRDEGGVVKVTNPSNNIAHLEFLGDLNGYDVELLEIVVYSTPPPNISFELNLNNSEITDMLRGSESVTLPFELDATVWVDSRDPTKGTKTIKIWKTQATIRRNILWDHMAALPPINWQSQASPVDYVPFSRSQFITGQQGAYLAVIGNGAQKTFAIAHNLGQDGGAEGRGVISVSVRENIPQGRQLRDDEYEIYFPNESSLVINFENPPASNSLAVSIVGYGPQSAFVIHTHPIDQIKTIFPDGAVGETLRGIIDNLSARIGRLEALLPRAELSLPSGLEKKKVFVPVIGEVLPDILLEGAADNVTISSQVVASQNPKPSGAGAGGKPPAAIAGTEADDQRRALEAEVQKLKAEAAAAVKAAETAAATAAEEFKKKAETEQAAKPKDNIATISVIGYYAKVTNSQFSALPYSSIRISSGSGDNLLISNMYPLMKGKRYPILFKAIHSEFVQSASSIPAQSGVYRNSRNFNMDLPAAPGRKPESVIPNELFACNSGYYYKVRRNFETNSYHPIEMERDLARVLIRKSQFPTGSKLNFSWSIDFGFDTDSLIVGAGYTMVVRATSVPDISSPSPVGDNIGSAGVEVVLAASKIALSRKTLEKISII